MLWVYHVSNKPRSSTITCGLESSTIFITTGDLLKCDNLQGTKTYMVNWSEILKSNNLQGTKTYMVDWSDMILKCDNLQGTKTYMVDWSEMLKCDNLQGTKTYMVDWSDILKCRSPEIMGVFTNKTAKQTLFVRERYLGWPVSTYYNDKKNISLWIKLTSVSYFFYTFCTYFFLISGKVIFFY